MARHAISRQTYSKCSTSINKPLIGESQGDAVAGSDLSDDSASGKNAHVDSSRSRFTRLEASVRIVDVVRSVSSKSTLIVHPPCYDFVVVRQRSNMHATHCDLDHTDF